MIALLLLDELAPEGRIPYPYAALAFVMTFLLAVFAVPHQRGERYYAWMVWAVLLAIYGGTLLPEAKKLEGFDALQAGGIGAILILIAVLTFTLAFLQRFASRVSGRSKAASGLIAVLLSSVLLVAWFRSAGEGGEQGHGHERRGVPCSGIAEAADQLKSGKYASAVEALKSVLSADARCIEARMLLIQAYTRMPAPDCEAALQHFLALPAAKKSEVHEEVKRCEERH